MRLIVVLALVAAGCGSSVTLGRSCYADSECQPLVCNAPFVGPGDPPQPGTCQQPAAAGGVCHRPAECADGLTCVIPAGGDTVTGGSCEK